MDSYVASPATIERKWYVVDAAGQTLGRLTSQVAAVLRGKNKPTYTPFIDTGDYVIVINADITCNVPLYTDQSWLGSHRFPSQKHPLWM